MTPYPLGRRVEHDPRSRNYAFTQAVAVLKTVSHRSYGLPLDQGNLGSCTGNAAAGALDTVPLHKTGERILREKDAVTLYEAATRLDPWPGSYPPDDTGSSGLAVAKACKNAGYITGYRHAFGLDQALAALQVGPVITGIPWYECAVDGTLVLTSDLEWRPVEKIEPGDRLIGFDEIGDRSSCYRTAIALSTTPIIRDVYEVKTDRGTVITSANHPFILTSRLLGSGKSTKQARQWELAANLREGDTLAYFGRPWQRDETWEAGWLAGFFDGEGTLSNYDPTGAKRHANTLCAAQKPGVALETALRILVAKGYDYGTKINQATGVVQIYLRGENAKCRFLGEIRPQRLLAVGHRAWEGHRTWSKSTKAAIVEQVKPLGREVVHALGTSSGTLITDGLLSHNSMFTPTAQGFVHIGGDLAGGHELCVKGYVAAERPYIVLWNSWGKSWGPLGGKCRMFVDEWAQLLSEDGDVTILDG